MIELSKIGNVGVGVIAYAVFHYGLAAPEIAHRIGRADYLAGCQQRYEAVLQAEEREAVASIKYNGPSAADDMGAEYIRKLTRSPQGAIFRQFGYDRMIALYEQKKRFARQAHARALAEVKKMTAKRLAASASVCETAINDAAASTQTEWAVFTGTVGIVRLPNIKDFDARIDEALRQRKEKT